MPLPQVRRLGSFLNYRFFRPFQFFDHTGLEGRPPRVPDRTVPRLRRAGMTAQAQVFSRSRLQACPCRAWQTGQFFALKYLRSGGI